MNKSSLLVHSRGAAFVEALIVISALTLGLVGLSFFREVYVRQLVAMRLARASVIAHALAACKANEPKQWVGRDLDVYTSDAPGAERETARGVAPHASAPPAAASPSGGPDRARAARLIGSSGAGTSDGEGLLNPIATYGFSRVTGQGTRTREPSGAKPSFSQRVGSRSYVSCGEEVKAGQYDQIIPMIRDEAQTLFGMKR